MKKILSVFLVLLAVLTLSSCKGDDEPAARTYVADGKYTAFEAQMYDGAPQLTWVTVTIKNDKIESFYIDQLQTKDGAWKEQTKKELGYAYRMHGQWSLSEEDYKAYLAENNLKEWFEQANLIEAHFLNTLEVTVDSANKIQGITGVTIADNAYIALAKKAVENAKAGIVNVFVANTYSGAVNLTSAAAKVNAEGKITEVKIDELQTSEGAWKAQTKQQLGYGYRMHATGANGHFVSSEADYKAYLVAEGKLEWFQQVDAVASAWLNGSNISNISSVTGVTISDSDYTTVLTKLIQEGWTR